MPRKIAIRKFLTNDDDPRGVLVILGREETAADQANAHGAEIISHDPGLKHVHRDRRMRWKRLGGEGVLLVDVTGRAGGEAGVANTGQRCGLV